MKNIWKVVENVTNIAVVVFVLLGGVFFYFTYKNNQPVGMLPIGASLPALTGYNWQSNSHSLVLVLRKDCHFCEESMPFYRKVYDLDKGDDLKVQMIAVFPDSAQEVNQVLHANNLPIPGISEFALSNLSVSGTPTLILVDRNGKIEKTWVGKLDSQGEKSVVAEMRKPAS
jgi:redoxin